MLDAAIELAEKLIAVESLTPTHPATPPEKADNGVQALQHLQSFAKSAALQHMFAFEGNDAKYPHRVHTLHTVWKSSVAGYRRVRLLYIGHVDVYPANPLEWKSNPFKPSWRKGVLYGRGAVDMKTPVACFFSAMEEFASATSLPFEVHAVITTDEEYAALNGVDRVLEHLKQQGLEYDAVLVGEPSSLKIFGDTLAKGRRGSYNMKIIIVGKKGHRAYSSANPLRRSNDIMSALYAIPFQPHPDWQAMTDIEVMDIRADSESTSGMPGKVEVSFNIRFTGNYTPAQLRKMVEKAIRPHRGRGMRVKLIPSDYPQAAYNGMPRGAPALLLRTLEAAIHQYTGVWPQHTQHGGWSDGSHVQKYWPNVPVLEFGPLVHTMHQPDEHIPREHIRVLCLILKETLEEYFRPYNRRPMEG